MRISARGTVMRQEYHTREWKMWTDDKATEEMEKHKKISIYREL